MDFDTYLDERDKTFRDEYDDYAEAQAEAQWDAYINHPIDVACSYMFCRNTDRAAQVELETMNWVIGVETLCPEHSAQVLAEMTASDIRREAAASFVQIRNRVLMKNAQRAAAGTASVEVTF